MTPRTDWTVPRLARTRRGHKWHLTLDGRYSLCGWRITVAHSYSRSGRRDGPPIVWADHWRNSDIPGASHSMCTACERAADA